MNKSPEQNRRQRITIGTAIAGGAIAMSGVALLEGSQSPVNQHPTLEKAGDHHGQTPHSEIGTAVVHTDHGDFKIQTVTDPINFNKR
ncbi:hypothetical protein KW801_03180 [Candidatus Saccharibacteria bacterium]|nr:hypothetical protein [Candidatus Saccharibacteria bacterium]